MEFHHCLTSPRTQRNSSQPLMLPSRPVMVPPKTSLVPQHMLDPTRGLACAEEPLMVWTEPFPVFNMQLTALSEPSGNFWPSVNCGHPKCKRDQADKFDWWLKWTGDEELADGHPSILATNKFRLPDLSNRLAKLNGLSTSGGWST